MGPGIGSSREGVSVRDNGLKVKGTYEISSRHVDVSLVSVQILFTIV